MDISGFKDRKQSAFGAFSGASGNMSLAMLCGVTGCDGGLLVVCRCEAAALVFWSVRRGLHASRANVSAKLSIHLLLAKQILHRQFHISED